MMKMLAYLVDIRVKVLALNKMNSKNLILKANQITDHNNSSNKSTSKQQESIASLK